MRDLVTRWEDWRKLIGPQNSRHRKLVLEQLKTQPALLYWGDRGSPRRCIPTSRGRARRASPASAC